ncbi:MAG: AAA family ATPase, partial [bacterium]
NNIINCYTTAARSRRKNDSQQIELSYIGEDSTEFIDFRKLLHENDYIIFLKKEKSVEYTVLGVKNIDAEKYGLDNVIVVYPSHTKVGTELVKNESDEIKDNSIDDSVARNKIIYGAPGTGKSYELEEERKKYFPENNLYERVTFHPRYTYNNFLGTYKPITLYKKSDDLIYDSDMKTEREKQMEPIIDYNFVPGPFIKILTKALNNKNKNYLLIIEEINRSDPAAVFGDVFQLLDRDATGRSRYPVTFNRDVMNYLNRKVDNFNNDFVSIPSNLYIWATMNSADQGVKSMDSAFRRRWSFNYIKLNKYQKVIKHKKIKLSFLDNKIYWNEFRSIINDHLKNYVREDKLIGPFFLTDVELMDHDSIKNKLLFYLREDVLIHNPGEIFSLKTFNQIIETYEKKENIFIDEIYQKLKVSEMDNIE